MTDSSTSASSLKIRIRFDDAEPLIEPESATATLDPRRVGIAVVLLVLAIAAVFGLRDMMKNNSPAPLLAPLAEVTAPPTPDIAPSSPAVAMATTPNEKLLSPNPANRVVRAVLTDSPRKHYPAQELAGDLPVSDVTKRFYFFTEVHDVVSRRLAHRWEYQGKAMAQISFKPSAANWSGSSNKQIPTHMQGAWRVALVDERGTVLSSVDFTYGKVLTTAQN